jgi:NhaA family Na+:H+ antiporter
MATCILSVLFLALLILPVFDIANAGVKLDISLLEVASPSIGLGRLLTLSLAKVMVVSVFSYIAERLRIAELHSLLKWQHIIGFSLIPRIGFTMYLFKTKLVFSDPDLEKISKISILPASLIAALGGITTLLLTKPKGDKQ